ncbi:uncharacterized protein LOC117326296 isoform X2 [Pecten maximus]|uniref:uncharacterized protein LOC117326296 isoform X2 n=1 Tax=Pecten maximus TaxID=6579 RepID=UPI00145823A2|nr:uncharacterized protein LOC117326296 isoform X2 [Pecten maximus]
MLQLYRNPSLWSVLALCVHAVNMLFHVIAYCSDQWATCTFKGRHTWFGLWQGCWVNDVTQETTCSDTIFQHPSLNTDTGWHTGGQILMTISFILLIFTEIVLIGYACVLKFEHHKPRMVGTSVGMLGFEVGITGILILMVGTEVGNLEDGYVSWGYGIKCTTMFLGIVTVILVYIDKYSFSGKKRDLVTQSEKAYDKNDFDNPGFNDWRSNEFSGSMMTSPMRVSSSGLGTLEKGSSRSLSCSDIVTVSADISYSQTPQTFSSKCVFGGSADDIAKTKHVMNFKDFRPEFKNGIGGPGSRVINTDSLTAKTRSVNMNPDLSDIVHRDGFTSQNHRLSSSSSIESDV